MTKKKKRLGEELIEKGLVSVDQVEIALTEQKKTGRLIGEILVSLGFVSESVMRDVLGKVLGVGSVDLAAGVAVANIIDQPRRVLHTEVGADQCGFCFS